MMKRQAQEEEHGFYPKHRKTAFATYLEKKEDGATKVQDDNKPEATGSIETTGDTGGTGEKARVVREEVDGEEEEEEEKDPVCQHCTEYPCVWAKKHEDMRIFDLNEHYHLPVDNCPPNNIRCKKVYWQMFLYLNQGPSGAGVRMQLPECIENGARLMFPSPSFMGFKDM
jgi:hypothetical protein